MVVAKKTSEQMVHLYFPIACIYNKDFRINKGFKDYIQDFRIIYRILGLEMDYRIRNGL